MLIERLENYYRDLASKRTNDGNWARASSLGMCQRRLAHVKLGTKQTPLTPRRVSIFHHGDAMDLALKMDLVHALEGEVIESNHRGSTMIDGVEVTGECDVFFHLHGRYGVADIKTMADRSFERACNGEIEELYQVQALVYSKIYGVDLVIFVCYRKETSHIVEVIFDANTPDTIVTKRYGGNEKEILTKDPLLIAEVSTPFAASLSERISTTLKNVDSCNSLDSLPVGINAVEPETVKVQGQEKATFKAQELGQSMAHASKSGSWYTFTTGRKILGFPCTYCPFSWHCFPQAQLEFENGRPRWVLPT